MGKIFSEIDSELGNWLTAQKLFFVATAPLSGDQHINCSPKGMDTFRIVGTQEVAYLDLTGSGIETVAHLHENGRIVLMFCAFNGPPRIVRLHGNGQVLVKGQPEFDSLVNLFPLQLGARAIIRVRLSRISDSCGYGVPKFEFQEQRETLEKWSIAKGESGLADYQSQKNASSIDGLKGL